MFAGAPQVRRRLADWGVEVVIFGVKQKMTDLPENASLRGKRDDDGYSFDRLQGMTRMNKVFVCEANLLALHGDRFPDESVLAHELGHLVMNVVLDDAGQTCVRETWLAARIKGLWKGRYAGTSPSEYWAELVQSYFGVNTPEDHNEAGELEQYDPQGFALVAAVFSDQPVPESPDVTVTMRDDGGSDDETSTGSSLQELTEALGRLKELLEVMKSLGEGVDSERD